MNLIENKVFDMIPREIKYNLFGKAMPSISHCVGTGRLLGEFYGKAICQECGIEDRNFIDKISQLSIFLRTFMVIDDFIKDKRISHTRKRNLKLWIENIKKKITLILSLIDDNSIILWLKYFSNYENGYTHFDRNELYSSILRKCFLMFLPFGLNKLKKTKNCFAAKKHIEYYLFSLQLIDDFHDMEEDIRSPKIHNLFLSSISDKNYMIVIKSRLKLVRPLLKYIEDNLTTRTNLKSDIIMKFFSHSLDWIKKKKLLFINYPLIEIFKGKYEKFIFDDKSISILNSVDIDYQIDLKDITAENMHTISS